MLTHTCRISPLECRLSKEHRVKRGHYDHQCSKKWFSNEHRGTEILKLIRTLIRGNTAHTETPVSGLKLPAITRQLLIVACCLIWWFAILGTGDVVHDTRCTYLKLILSYIIQWSLFSMDFVWQNIYIYIYIYIFNIIMVCIMYFQQMPSWICTTNLPHHI